MISKRKIFGATTLFLLFISLCACSEIDKTGVNLPNYVNFNQLTDGYGVENAVDDGCVVLADSKLISGGDMWNSFITTIEKKQACCVRIARFYSIEDNLCLIDLSYVDSSFSVNTSDGFSATYKYLNKYETNVKSSDSGHSIIECFVLVNQKNITYQEIERAMTSSILSNDDAIDYYIVYSSIRSL